MAITGFTINTGVAGDNFDITVPIPGIPNGQTLTKAWFTAKLDATDADVAAIIQKIVTTVGTSDGQITDTGLTDLNGEVVFALSPTDMRAIRDQGPLTFDVQVYTSAGKVYTYMTMCTITAIQEVTLALS